MSTYRLAGGDSGITWVGLLKFYLWKVNCNICQGQRCRKVALWQLSNIFLSVVECIFAIAQQVLARLQVYSPLILCCFYFLISKWFQKWYHLLVYHQQATYLADKNKHDFQIWVLGESGQGDLERVLTTNRSITWFDWRTNQMAPNSKTGLDSFKKCFPGKFTGWS